VDLGWKDGVDRLCDSMSYVLPYLNRDSVDITSVLRKSCRRT
jgi:hypothetical protein